MVVLTTAGVVGAAISDIRTIRHMQGPAVNALLSQVQSISTEHPLPAQSDLVRARDALDRALASHLTSPDTHDKLVDLVANDLESAAGTGTLPRHRAETLRALTAFAVLDNVLVSEPSSEALPSKERKRKRKKGRA